MGANAVTTVPVYTAGEVLTAADLNITNSGIPVFASTVERDAAFGGTGEKTLAEGQFAYLETGNVTQYYDGAAWQPVAGGKIAQVLNQVYGTSTSTTSTSYVTSGLSLAITPSLATSKVLITATFPFGTGGNAGMQVTVFRGTVADTNLAVSSDPAFASMYIAAGGAGQGALTFLDSPATTSATTYTIGFRSSSGSVTAVMQESSRTSSLVLMEVLA